MHLCIIKLTALIYYCIRNFHVNFWQVLDFTTSRSRQAIVSHKAKKKHHAAHLQAYATTIVNYVFTQMAALNISNAVAQPLLQQSLSLLQTQHFLLSETNS